jgi:hypothetical protein
MAFYRLLLALLIGLAVATAPIGVGMASAKAAAKTAMMDCHGKAKKPCPDCDGKVGPGKANHSKCPGDGSKCCKLTGTIAALPDVLKPVIIVEKIPQPQSVPDRPLRPHTPPPRS